MPSTIIPAFNLLKKDDVDVLLTKKGYGSGQTHLGLVGILFIPDLAVLHVKSQRAKHRLLPALSMRAGE